MEIAFGDSARSTLGLEWELALVERGSRDLAPAAPDILHHLTSSDPEIAHRVTSELLTNTVEVVSGVNRTVADGVADLSRTVDLVRDAADRLGLDVLCAGTHPFAKPDAQHVTEKERYRTLIERTQLWGRQLLIWGVHMHVGITDKATVLPILEALLTYYGHFQSLSASSPFFDGAPTGYASTRAMLFQQLPTAGLPPQLPSWEAYEGVVGDLLHVGVIDHVNEIRWDVRPSPKWGTLEFRACDGLPSAFEVGALAALAQCLVDDFADRLGRGETLPSMQPWFVRENKWRAARYGMDAILIVNSAGDERLISEDLPELVERLTPVAARLDCEAELHSVLDIAAHGASYQRQLVVSDRGGLTAVVDSLVAELAAGHPLP